MMELIIKVLSGETKSVHVNPNATIGELKKQIAPLFNARPSQLQLSITNGQTSQLNQDQMMVKEYGLCSGSTVMLLISATPVPMQVFVKNEKGQTKTYDITEKETVDQLMLKVFRKEGIPVDQQRLMYNGKQLESGKDLHYYNIVPGSTIHMVFHLRGG
ncbi:polyubiquitin 12-like [Silurus meridionalis]|uniref:Ubiquitin-like domain-containing protein n=1 Tax=Silurus meridionalis TaxID=175797 RepID=A0A8T0A7L4_SILME|nr:polyubiquitin 12-like [Silurus meridionalis]KAF7687694.1 hypothetical protein HF521_014922 [Silurus meridionalis]